MTTLSAPLHIVAQLPPASMRRVLSTPQWTAAGVPRQQAEEYKWQKCYHVSIGVPEIYQLHPNEWCLMTSYLQHWYFEALCHHVYGYYPLTGALLAEAKFQWAKLLDDGRAFTNNTGTDTHRDYINGTNMTAPLMEWEPLVTGGNTVEVTGEPVKITKNYLGWGMASLWHFPIRTINPRALPTVDDFLHDACVCHVPSTITADGQSGVFPQYEGRAIVPLLSNGQAWIWEKWLE